MTRFAVPPGCSGVDVGQVCYLGQRDECSPNDGAGELRRVVWVHAVSDRLIIALANNLCDDNDETNRSYAVCSDHKVGVHFRAIFKDELNAITEIGQALQCFSQVNYTRRYRLY